jgi:bifunctional DNA-binding transcriptional regulator/antitoxin component of YhaV-PrlF toxin-antitoxin module
MNNPKKFALRVRKKRIIPKALRIAADIDEGSFLIAEIREEGLILKSLTVRINPDVVEKILSEEKQIEEGKFLEIIRELHY